MKKTSDTSPVVDSASPCAICVDLDDTLISQDCLWTLAASVLPRPSLWRKILWPLSWSHMKSALARYGVLDPKTLVYNTILLRDIHRWKKEGHAIYLVTGAHQSVADKIARHLGCFDEVFGSSDTYNLSGKNKGKFLCHVFGKGNFWYIGDCWKDRHVWCWCAVIGIVSSNGPLLWYMQHKRKSHQGLIRYTWKGTL